MEELEKLLEQRIEYIKKTYDEPEKEIRIREVNLTLYYVKMINLNSLINQRMQS